MKEVVEVLGSFCKVGKLSMDTFGLESLLCVEPGRQLSLVILLGVIDSVVD